MTIEMNKTSIVLKYFQKKDQLTIRNRQYQKTISTLFGWLADNDKVTNDKTTKYLPERGTKAIIIAKQNGIIAGLEETGYLLDKYTKLVFNPKTEDGSEIKKGETIAQIIGKSHEILAYERTILNILQRMSGVASETNRLINIINTSCYTSSITNTSDRVHLLSTITTPPHLAATRKTPWMGLDKKAVAVGGGLTHRLDLSDGILIKDNHLKLSTIEKAIEAFLKRPDPRRGPASTELIEIEVTSEKQARQVLKTFLQPTTHNYLAILLDNFTPAKAKSLLSDLENLGNISEIIFEASGGITSDNILEWAQTGVDILSMGSLTHSSKVVNLSLELSP